MSRVISTVAIDLDPRPVDQDPTGLVVGVQVLRLGPRPLADAPKGGATRGASHPKTYQKTTDLTPEPYSLQIQEQEGTYPKPKPIQKSNKFLNSCQPTFYVHKHL